MTYRPITDVMILARPKHKYYGAYPAGFVERGRLMLGAQIDDAILHVCSGRVRDYPFAGVGPSDMTVDIDKKTKPDVVMDVRKDLPDVPHIPRHLNCASKRWRAMMVDTPYSEDEAGNYACGSAAYPQPGPLLKLCLERVRPGGRVGFLHWLWPNPPKMVDGCVIKEVFVALVTTGRGSRARHYVVFEKVAPRVKAKR
jgi:hypothetical protein